MRCGKQRSRFGGKIWYYILDIMFEMTFFIQIVMLSRQLDMNLEFNGGGLAGDNNLGNH